MKPYEEIDFSNGFLRWIREDGMYVCRMTEEQMAKIKALHEAPRTWVGLTRTELIKCGVLPFGMSYELYEAIEAKLKEKNND
jgi:hypothetical protein